MKVKTPLLRAVVILGVFHLPVRKEDWVFSTENLSFPAERKALQKRLKRPSELLDIVMSARSFAERETEKVERVKPA